MTTIYKYQLYADNRPTEMPAYAKVLSAGVQAGEIFIWALVDTTAESHQRQLYVYPTGGAINPMLSEKLKLLNTVFVGALVFHVFETTQD